MFTGAFPDDVTADLEALKLRLAGLVADDAELSLDRINAMSAEIGAIRLHLKRLALEQETLGAELRRRSLET